MANGSEKANTAVTKDQDKELQESMLNDFCTHGTDQILERSAYVTRLYHSFVIPSYNWRGTISEKTAFKQSSDVSNHGVALSPGPFVGPGDEANSGRIKVCCAVKLNMAQVA